LSANFGVETQHRYVCEGGLWGELWFSKKFPKAGRAGVGELGGRRVELAFKGGQDRTGTQNPATRSGKSSASVGQSGEKAAEGRTQKDPFV